MTIKIPNKFKTGDKVARIVCSDSILEIKKGIVGKNIRRWGGDEICNFIIQDGMEIDVYLDQLFNYKEIIKEVVKFLNKKEI